VFVGLLPNSYAALALGLIHRFARAAPDWRKYLGVGVFGRTVAVDRRLGYTTQPSGNDDDRTSSGIQSRVPTSIVPCGRLRFLIPVEAWRRRCFASPASSFPCMVIWRLSQLCYYQA
jgi:hypothetical protein